jgi:hypothetical protein
MRTIQSKQFKVNDRVKVSNVALQTYGCTGQVEGTNYWGDTINVRLDFNHKIYTYKRKNLTIVNEQNNITNKGDNNMLMGNYNVAMVKFLQGMNTTKEYAFALFDTNIVVNDLVLCDTQNGYGVAKVEEIVSQNDYNGVPVTKEIICKVDFTDFEQRKENRAKAKQLKVDMDKKIKGLQEIALYEMMAEKCPELKDMLNAYKELMK